MRMRQFGPDPAGGINEGDAIIIMFGNAGGDGKDIRVEDDVGRFEIERIHQ